jgi:hypothetical protein
MNSSYWKVIVDYDGALPPDEQLAVDQELDRLADASGSVVDSGSGAGFGRRDLDYAFETESEADAFADAVRAAFDARPELDLTVRSVEIEEDMDV